MTESKNPLTPKELIKVYSFDGTLNKVFAADLKIHEIFGWEAEMVYREYRYHSSIEKDYEKYPDLDPRVARLAYEKFIEITGFSPDDLKVELYAVEKYFGLDKQAYTTFKY